MEALAIVHSPEVIKAQRPYESAEEVLITLSKEHDIFYISNRAPKSQDATEEWLFDLNNFPKAEVICIMEDKQPYLVDCQYLIDDRCKTLVEFVFNKEWVGRKRQAFGLAFPYNQNLTDVPNIYLAPTWLGLKFYLERKGVLNGRHTGSLVPA